MMSVPEKFDAAEQSAKQMEFSPLALEAQQSYSELRHLNPPVKRTDSDDDIAQIVNDGFSDEIYGRTSSYASREDESWISVGEQRGRGNQWNKDYSMDRREQNLQQQYEDKVVEANKFLRRNFNALDQNGDNQVSEREIDRALRSTRNPEAREQLKTLKENFVDIRDAQPYDHSYGLSRADVYATSHDLERNRDVREFAEDLRVARSLLFRVLDSAKGGGEDGKISKGDLERFLKDSDPRNPWRDMDFAHNTMNRQIVMQMLRQWDDPDSAVYQLRGGGRFITQGSINQALDENRFGEKPRERADIDRDPYRQRSDNLRYSPRMTDITIKDRF